MNSQAYTIWHSMLQRSYDSNYHKKEPTYKSVVVYEEWHNFQNFAEWFYTKSDYQEGWHLDKDLLSTDNKIYSQATCLFIPRKLNNFLANVQLNNTSGYTGVSWYKPTNKWAARIYVDEKPKHLGYYTNKQIAALMYKLARRKEANKWKEKMQGTLPQKAINGIK